MHVFSISWVDFNRVRIFSRRDLMCLLLWIGDVDRLSFLVEATIHGAVLSSSVTVCLVVHSGPPRLRQKLRRLLKFASRVLCWGACLCWLKVRWALFTSVCSRRYHSLLVMDRWFESSRRRQRWFVRSWVLIELGLQRWQLVYVLGVLLELPSLNVDQARVWRVLLDNFTLLFTLTGAHVLLLLLTVKFFIAGFVSIIVAKHQFLSASIQWVELIDLEVDAFMVARCQDATLDLFLKEHALCRVLDHWVTLHINGDSGAVVRVNRGWILRASRIDLMLLQLSLLFSHRLEPLELIQWLIESILFLCLLMMPVLHHVSSLHRANNYDLLVAWRLQHVLWTADFTARVRTDYEQSVTVLAVSCIILYLLFKSSELLTWRIVFHLMVGDYCRCVLFSYVARLWHIVLIDIDQLARAVRIELLNYCLTRVVIFSTSSGWNNQFVIDLGAIVLSCIFLIKDSNWGANSTFCVNLWVVWGSLLAHYNWTSLDNWIVSLACGLYSLWVSKLRLSDAIEGASACLSCGPLVVSISIFDDLRKTRLRR